jgi:D-beta-D-heptose 7-phosphate kinase/D-beta-D-heptose 1-phosphate adenosyltransferase
MVYIRAPEASAPGPARPIASEAALRDRRSPCIAGMVLGLVAVMTDSAPADQLDFSAARVLVVGDVMLDRYWTGPAQRISPEAPVPIVRVEDNDERCGGAANVAVNIARLGAGVCLIGAVGEDEQGATLRSLLDAAGVQSRLFAAPGAGTTVKLRLLSQHQQLIRLDFERAVLAGQIDEIARAFAEEIERHDVVIFSDYGKGALSEIPSLLERAHRLGRISLVDPWGDDFSRYRHASAITPNAHEFARAAGEACGEADLERRARAMVDDLSLGAVLVTRGERGMSLFARDTAAVHIPSEAREVFDVTGAGDTVIAALATGLASGWSMERAARLANRAAGLVVAKLGTAAVSPAELADRRVMSGEELARAAGAARAAGQRVVMTNGCFDIIHAGHISYLSEAARLGDRLAVAINSDASVRRLKGEGRPINPLRHRLEVVAALRCVDWVAPFDGTRTSRGFDDTPADLIGQVMPDVLVKGADYDVADIAGADAVLANGGRVLALPVVGGVSTSALIEQIRKLAP